MYSVINIETTGLDTVKDRIIEIAIVNVNRETLQVKGMPYTSYFNIPFSMQSPRAIGAQKTNGITDADLRHAPKFENVWGDIQQYTVGNTLVIHNVKFDYPFLQNEFGRAGVGFQRLTYCTLQNARRLFPGLKSYSLTNLSKAFRTETSPNHRALQDTLTTLEIFRELMKKEKYLSV